MNQVMREAFQAGSGIDPASVRLTLTLIAAGVLFAVCAWIALQLLDAMNQEEISARQALLGMVKTGVLAALCLYAISM